MKASDLFVKCLENENAEYVFGLPGEELKDLMFSLKDSKIKFIVTRHEQGAAFMADVYGRIYGRAGICMATLGPGASNLVTGIADANLDHAPLVAITAQGSLDRLHKESHQIIDIVDMFRPITKWNTRISAAKIIPEAVRKAFKLAEEEKPGATHLELPEDIAAKNTEGNPLRREKVRRSAPDYKALHKAMDLINSSKKPLIITGNGAIRKLASNQLRIFVENTKIPVISTFMGKGAVSDFSKESLLTLGMGAPKEIMKVIDASDLIITIGYDIAELDPAKWNMGGKKILDIDFHPSEIYDKYQPEVEVVADISNTLWNFNQEIKKQFDFQEAKDYRKFVEDKIFNFSDKAFPVHPKQALISLRNAVKKGSIIISDVGSHKMWIGSMFPTRENDRVIISNGFASMGIALPGAIGAKLASPQTDVIAIMGDGGFLMNMQELETAKRLGIDITLIIFNDSSYSLIEAKFMNDNKSTFGTDFSNPDFEGVAKAFGCKYYGIKNANELESVYEQAINEKGVKIIDILIDKEKNFQLFR